MQPDDLRGAARDAYDMWRNTFGLSEQGAMRALEQDGAIPLSDDEKLARRFQNIFGLSESEARRAVHGHGGSSVPPVSESAERSSAAPQPGDALRLVGKIEKLSRLACATAASRRRRRCGRRRLQYFRLRLTIKPRTGWRRSLADGGRGYGAV
jgi:hypothetical protein